MLLRRLVCCKGVIEESCCVIKCFVACAAIQIARLLRGVLRLLQSLYKVCHVHPHKVNPNIPFLKKRLVASLTGTCEFCDLLDCVIILHLLLVLRVHMEVQKILLEKLHITVLTSVGQIAFMLLQMVIHGALILLDGLAMRAHEVSISILHVL